jgi:uncharacterized membrane-anchored protein
MTETPRRILLVLALLLPIAAVGAMIGRAELVVKTGTEWAVPIRGYDPRDLLRGDYLRYDIAWKLESQDCTGGACCYCLWNGHPDQPSPPIPSASIVSCADRAPCTSYFPVERADSLRRYFIPEGEGTRLETAIRNREAMLLLRVSSRGRVVITDLLLDRKPWREVLPK